MGYANLDNNNPEGSFLSQRFPEIDAKIKTGATNCYQMRSPATTSGHRVSYVFQDGSQQYANANDGGIGIVPVIVLC